MSLRIGWVSAVPYARTGYGVQTKDIVFRLVDEGFDIICIGDTSPYGHVWGGSLYLQTEKGNSVLCLPSSQQGQGYTEYYVKRYGIDLLIIFWDPFNHLSYLKSIPTPQLWYIPVDGPITEKWYNVVNHVYRIIAYSKYGYNELLKWFPPSRVRLIYHGIDCTIFKPLSEKEKQKARQSFGIPEDAFVFLNVSANIGTRKCLPHLMLTFSKLAKQYDDVYLYLYTNSSDYPRGFDIYYFARQFGIEDRVILPPNDPIIDPLEDEDMAKLFGCVDFYCSTAEAEGFTIPLLQSIACGVPTIAVANSAQTELAEGNGILVEPSIDYVSFPLYVPYHTMYRPPSLQALYVAMESAYRLSDEEYKELRKKAREKALKYDWSVIIPKWKALLNEVEEELTMLRSLV